MSCLCVTPVHVHDSKQLLQLDADCLTIRCCVLQSFLPVPYFASERSFAQFRLPEDTKTIVGFGSSNSSLVAVSNTGSFFTASFDPDKGGVCKQESFCKFVELDA